MNVFIERFIGTFQRECLDYHYAPLNAAELSGIVEARLHKYNHYRPRASLGFLTPAQFAANFEVVLSHSESS
jgi:transposase InsO family protein